MVRFFELTSRPIGFDEGNRREKHSDIERVRTPVQNLLQLYLLCVYVFCIPNLMYQSCWAWLSSHSQKKCVFALLLR